MYTNDRNAYREVYFTVWQKHLKKLPLEALEAQLLTVMLQHTEYYFIFENRGQFLKQEFAVEENPFFHLSLHLAINEQRITNRPLGIREIHAQLLAKYQDQHEVEHRLMEGMTRMMQLAQETGSMPSDEVYLAALREI